MNESRAQSLRHLVGEWDDIVGAQADRPGSTLKPPATEEQIAALESRLGVRLPNSYREFLSITNGTDALLNFSHVWRSKPGEHPTGMCDSDEADWTRAADPDMHDIWGFSGSLLGDVGSAGNPGFISGLSEREYLDYSLPPDPVPMKVAHTRYALSIGKDIDGYTILLNPLIVDADGEWEAWDFGAKLPGANRYPSFRALLEASIAHERRWIEEMPKLLAERGLAANPAGVEDLKQLDRDLEAVLREPPDRSEFASWFQTWGEAMRRLTQSKDPRARAAFEETLARTGEHEFVRQAAAQTLVTATPEPELPPLLLRLAEDRELRVRAAALPKLAASSDPECRALAVRLLVDPSTESWAMCSLPGGEDALRDAWLQSSSSRVLQAWTMTFDSRCIEPLAEAISNPKSVGEWGSVIGTAWRFHDQRIRDALIEASSVPGAPSYEIAEALIRAGAGEEAVALLAGMPLEQAPFGGAVAGLLGQVRLPSVAAPLLRCLKSQPVPVGVVALGRYPSEDAVEYLATLLCGERNLEALDSLETMRTSESTDAIAEASAGGEMLATRALARLGDGRALRPLLDALSSDDPAVALDGADGLRDLRSAEATDALLEATSHSDPDVAVTATHALICMRSPQMVEGIRRLSGHKDHGAEKLASRWLAIAEACALPTTRETSWRRKSARRGSPGGRWR